MTMCKLHFLHGGFDFLWLHCVFLFSLFLFQCLIVSKSCGKWLFSFVLFFYFLIDLFGWSLVTDLEFEFLVIIHHIYLRWQHLRIFFLLSFCIVVSLLYLVLGKFDRSFTSISFILCSVSLIVVWNNFIDIFISRFAQSCWVLYYYLTISSFCFQMVGSRSIFKPLCVKLSQ